MIKFKILREKNIGKIYFIYIFLVLFLQIIGINSKGSFLDTVWKASVITLTVIYCLYTTNKVISKKIIIPIIIYVLGQIACLFFMANSFSVINLTNMLVIVAMGYFFVSIPLTTKKISTNDLVYFFNYFILLMLYAVIYNLITNSTAVINVFSNNNVYSNMMSSFFDNKQTFGMFLFMAILVSVWQYYLTDKKKYIYISFIFTVNLFICLSRTALFSCLIFWIVLGILSLKTDKKMSLIILISVFLILILLYLIPFINHFVFEVLLNTNDTLEARTNIWSDASQLLKNGQWIFGFGEGNVATALRSIGSKGTNSHNGLIHILLTGGGVKLLIYIMILFMSLKNIFSIYKFNKKIFAIELASFVSILSFSMGESLVLLDTSAPSIIASILMISFPIIIRRTIKNERGYI